MTEREAFLSALAQNEDDTVARLVFADWLEEQGEHEEADRHRKWPAAKQWLVQFCKENNPSPGDYNYEEVRPISYDALLLLALEAVDPLHENVHRPWEKYGNPPPPNGPTRMYFGNNETMRDAMMTHCATFWQNWSIVTGIPLTGLEDQVGFSCGC